jgi:hypothetical protein
MKIFAQEVTQIPIGSKPTPPNNDNSWQLFTIMRYGTVTVKCKPYVLDGKEYTESRVDSVLCYWQREEGYNQNYR